MPISQINVRTEEIDEILGKTPNSLIRWGITVIFLVIVVLLAGSWFFKYPDKVAGEIEITTLDPPVVIVSKSSGKLDTLLVRNNQMVNRGDLLGVIENPANCNDVFLMKKIIDSLKTVTENDTLKDIMHYVPPSTLDLGELQNYFTSFITAFNNLARFIKLRFYTTKIGTLKKQISDYQLYYNYAYERKRTIHSDYLLSEKEFNRYLKLFRNDAIAESELDAAKSRYLNKKSAYESSRTQLANINIQISQLQSKMTDLQLQRKKEKNRLLIELSAAFRNLNAQTDIWENRYLLTAPVSGKCIFTRYRSENQNITVGEPVMTIIPVDTANIIGRMLLPRHGAGKVKTGQRVNIRLENFPYMEFGQLEGEISKIAEMPDKKGFYYIEVQFPNGMITSYGKPIPFSQNIHGRAEIITKNIRLLYRIIQPIRSLFTENT